MTTAISDAGVQFASGNIVNVASAMPSSGSYTAGDIVLENTTAARISGWKRLTTGSNHVLGTDWSYFAGVTAGTAVATTSGTAIDFTGIPSWVKRITVMFNGVSLNGSSILLIQLGDSGGIENSGYSGYSSYQQGGGGAQLNSTGFQFYGTGGAANANVGAAVLTKIDGNTWVISALVSAVSGSWVTANVSGAKTLSDTLTQVRLTTVNGTDTFDAGSVNILWE